MSQTIIRPTRAGAVTQLTRSTGTSNWSCVDEAVANNDTDYVYGASQTQGVPWTLTDTYGRTTFSTVGVSSIASVTVYAVARKTTGVLVGNINVGLYNPSIGQDGGTVYVMTDNYQTFSHTWLVNPWTGVAWTAADLGVGANVPQLAVDLETDSESEQAPVRCTQVYGVIEWRPVVRKVTIPVGAKLVIPAGSKLKVG